MKIDFATIGFLAIGAAALYGHRRQRQQFTAPDRTNTPNATRTSEHVRDLEQNRFSGYAATPPFVQSSTSGAATSGW
jgi:hypothetical protein